MISLDNNPINQRDETDPIDQDSQTNPNKMMGVGVSGSEVSDCRSNQSIFFGSVNDQSVCRVKLSGWLDQLVDSDGVKLSDALVDQKLVDELVERNELMRRLKRDTEWFQKTMTDQLTQDHMVDSLKYATVGIDHSVDTPVNNQVDIGHAAELLVASDLTFLGHTVSFAPQMCPYDLMVDVGDRILRVQVKATASPYKWNNIKSMKYRFRLQKGGNRRPGDARKDYSVGEVDIFALVAADIRTIAYIPFSDQTSNCLEFYPPNAEYQRRSTSRVITDFPFNKALNQLTKAYQPLISCGDECSTQNQSASYLSGERDIKDIPT